MVSFSDFRLEPRLSVSVKVLRRWGPVLAGQIDGAEQRLADAQRRLPDLAARVTVPSKACRGNLEGAILPGAAIYLELLDHIDKERALTLAGACIAADAERRSRVVHLFDRTPWIFPIFRRMMRLAARRTYVPPAWEAQMLEDTPQRVRFDVTRCYYLDTLTTLGIPELTARYCPNDDVIWGNLRHIEFRRAGTLGYGCDRCDFYYERRAGRDRGRPVDRAGA